MGLSSVQTQKAVAKLLLCQVPGTSDWRVRVEAENPPRLEWHARPLYAGAPIGMQRTQSSEPSTARCVYHLSCGPARFTRGNEGDDVSHIGGLTDT
jgi:hypothetical protein